MLADLRIPVIAAPMAGPSTPELVAAVSGAGGLGFVAAGYLAEQALLDQIARVRALTDAPFGVNLFVPGPRSDVDLTDYTTRMAEETERYGAAAGSPHWDDDLYAAKVEAVLDQRIPVVSFTFGVPTETTVDRLRANGTTVVVTVTTPEEARLAAEVGPDALCVQGMEAGGHRAAFVNDPEQAGGGELYGLLALLRLVQAEVALPVIATGGLTCGADVAGVLAAGAVAAQLGTAFLVCDEAGTQPVHRAELLAGDRGTTLTRAFSGRPARGLRNRFMAEHGAKAPAVYPQLHNLTKPIRAAAGKAGDPEAMSMWAGQTYSTVTPLPAADLVVRLDDQAREAVAQLRGRW